MTTDEVTELLTLISDQLGRDETMITRALYSFYSGNTIEAEGMLGVLRKYKHNART